MNAVKDMFKDPKFRDLYQAGRQYDDASSYFSSAAFKAFDAAAGGKVGPDRPDPFPPTCMIQLGGDGVSLLNFGQRTATVIGVRCEELPGEVSQSQLAWRPFIVIEGPKEPSRLHDILAHTVRELREHGPMKFVGVSISCADSPDVPFFV